MQWTPMAETRLAAKRLTKIAEEAARERIELLASNRLYHRFNHTKGNISQRYVEIADVREWEDEQAKKRAASVAVRKPASEAKYSFTKGRVDDGKQDDAE